MTFQEWVTANQTTWNKLTNQNVKTYLLNKFHNQTLLMASADANKYFEFKLIEYKIELAKITFLEREYDKVWANAELLQPTITSTGTGQDEYSNVGYNADSVFKRDNNSTTNTSKTNDIINQLTNINNWLMQLYDKLDGMVVGMLRTIRNVEGF